MEEDIKHIEYVLDLYKESGEFGGRYISGNLFEKDFIAIEHLIKAYKELQKENEELKLKNNAIKRESEAYAERMINIDNELNLEKEKSRYEWIRQNCLPQNLIDKLYIPISLVKEKIERLNKEEQQLQNSIYDEERQEYSDANISFNLMDIEIRRSVLQELLEGDE